MAALAFSSTGEGVETVSAVGTLTTLSVVADGVLVG